MSNETPERGVHLPGAGRQAIAFVLLAGLAVGGWVFYREYVKAKEAARRTACMGNTRQIGLAMLQYAQDHDNQFPKDLAVLLQGPEVYLTTLKVFICPSSDSNIPEKWWYADPKTITNEELEEFNCYVLVPGASYDWPPEFILLHDKKDNHDGAGRNCWFNDGHTEWLTEEKFQQRMKAQEAKLRELRSRGEEQ